MANLGKGLGMAAGAGLGTFAGPAGIALGASLGGMFGGLFDDSTADIEAAIQNAIKQFEGIVPPDLAKAIVYTAYQQGGQLTPQQLSALPIEAQQAILLKEDPKNKARQLALQSMAEETAQTGYDPQARFALEQSRLKAAQDFAANLKSIEQQSQQRGLAGSGASLAMQLAASQQTAQNEYLQNLQSAALAMENKRGALAQAMSGAQSLRQQDLAVDQSNVEAKRQRQIFDMQNQMSRQQMNAQMAQQANLYNLQRAQQVADKNIQQQNEENYRLGYLVPQQMFANQLGLASAKSNVYQNQAKMYGQQAGAEGQGWANIFSGIGQAGAAFGKDNPDAWKSIWGKKA